ncbi:MAG: C40 family peptidase [Actinomycetia bacterium]|nr:C40 family peptidase [Actinomycetes bacterium]MCH9701612.1 C40 family peptidase [Actinomycetes bacterium]MCH9761777.1 C40 family peptidase [Actinomycetes bacterium]
MPSALVSALAVPIRRLQALVGPGWSSDPAADPTAALAEVHRGLAEVAAAAGQAWNRIGPGWSGVGADAAAGFAMRAAAAIADAAESAGHLGARAEVVAGAVARAHRRLQAIVDEFEARASELESYLDAPGGAEELLAEARRSLAEAISVVEELLAELDRHAAALDSAAPAGPTSAIVPAGLRDAESSGGSGFGGAPLASPAGWGGAAGFADLAGFTREGLRESADEAMFGDGLAVRLPDGTVVLAPNAVAASAVRHALTQLGVPYRWGGTTPDAGLDCSGLTQWAYHEAGLNIPRLAQDQDVGAAVAAGSLRPGDLAVWDGHVAMIVGAGTMIEAGDPVQLSPIRTANAGQGFQGFWRPTA